jgi:hypothetical protein
MASVVKDWRVVFMQAHGRLFDLMPKRTGALVRLPAVRRRLAGHSGGAVRQSRNRVAGERRV